MIAPVATTATIANGPRPAEQDVVDLRVRAPRGPRSGPYRTTPAWKYGAEKWPPAVEVTGRDDGATEAQFVEPPSHKAKLLERSVRDMGTVYRHGAEPLSLVLAGGDYERSACLIFAQLR